MTLHALLLLGAAAAAACLIALAFRLLRDPRRDLLGPPKKKPRKLSAAELDALTALVGRGEEAEALRRLEGAGYDERQAKRLLWLMTKIAETDGGDEP